MLKSSEYQRITSSSSPDNNRICKEVLQSSNKLRTLHELGKHLNEDVN